MTTPDITLKKAKETANVRTHRASDFLTDEQMQEVHESNAKGKAQPKYDIIDAYIAEIIARFGYDTYVAWKAGDIEQEQMVKYIEAERSREIADSLSLKSILIASVAGANQPTKSGHMPKSLKNAINILKKEQSFVKGAK